MSPELTTPGQDTVFIDFAAKRFVRVIAELDLTFKPRFINCLLSCEKLSVFESRFYKLSTQRRFQPEKTLHDILESIFPILLSLQDEETGRGHSASCSCFVALCSRLSSR